MSSPTPESRNFDPVLQGHRELHALLNAIHKALAEKTATVAEVSDLIAQLGDRLVKHFAMEEDGGYFSEALLRAPQLVAKANQLLAQHPKICSQAKSLAVELQAAPTNEGWWTKTAQVFGEFRDELLRHERQEDRLIQDAYVQDVGSHD